MTQKWDNIRQTQASKTPLFSHDLFSQSEGIRTRNTLFLFAIGLRNSDVA